MNALQKEIKNTFFQTLEDLKIKKEFEIFFNDFFDRDELETFTKRLAIAYWLKKKRTVENIKTNLKATREDIDFVKSRLQTKGIKLAVKHMEAEEWSNIWSEKIKKLGKLH
ncbi:MAG: hypothetical protein ACD_19C00016G0017 [uncultured bacterium]|nr:MAG: hypothetical protein ACD_19C00016G0017 [uncultured bacterium]